VVSSRDSLVVYLVLECLLYLDGEGNALREPLLLELFKQSDISSQIHALLGIF
jgi:hypothetical protein